MKRLLFWLLMAPQIIFGQTKLYPPKVEISDYTLSRFITELTLAVGKKDKAFIINNMNPNIKNGFGSDHGIKEFKKTWDFENPDSKFWLVVERLLTLGGSKYIKGSNQYSIPFIYSDWENLDEQYDAYSYALITGTKVNLRDKPNLNDSKVLGQLNYDVVKPDWTKTQESKDQHQLIKANYMDEYSWVYICTIDEKLCGYVYWEYISSPIDYRMGFIKENGKWQISLLVAGD